VIAGLLDRDAGVGGMRDDYSLDLDLQILHEPPSDAKPSFVASMFW
jgi:hypothetical protein